MSALRWILVAALLATLAAAATAEAQQNPGIRTSIRLDIESFQEPLKPGVPTTVNGTLTYSWDNGAVATGETTITLAAEPPGGFFNASVEPTSLTFSPGMGTAGSESQPFTVTVTASADVPAEERADTSISAASTANGNLLGSTTVSTLNFVSAFVSNLTVTPPGNEVIIKGGAPATIEFRVRNGGNADVNVGLVVTAPTDVEFKAPASLILKAGEEAVVPVEVRTPWTGGITGELTLSGTPTPIDVDGKGKKGAATLNLVSTSAVPADGAALSFAAVALAGVLLARRRRA